LDLLGCEISSLGLWERGHLRYGGKSRYECSKRDIDEVGLRVGENLVLCVGCDPGCLLLMLDRNWTLNSEPALSLPLVKMGR
jgi:hypothetical protein